MHPLSREQIPVQRAILDRFQDVLPADTLAAAEVGEGAGDFEDPIVGAGGKIELLHRVFEAVVLSTS